MLSVHNLLALGEEEACSLFCDVFKVHMTDPAKALLKHEKD